MAWCDRQTNLPASFLLAQRSANNPLTLRATSSINVGMGELVAIGILACAQVASAAPAAHVRLASMSLEELGEIDVSAASLLPASLLGAGFSIDSVGPEHWRSRGARRTLEALQQQPATLVLPHTSGNQVLAIRGYARNTSYTGVATAWDGVPLNDLFRSAPQFLAPAINLGALSQIQLIRGPGSALYGSDAFHGLIALRGYEADADQRVIDATAGSNGYYDLSFQQSRPWSEAVRLSIAWAANGQADQHRFARFTHPSSGQPQAIERADRYAAQTLTLKFASDAESATSWYGGVYLHHYDADDFQGLGTRLSGDRDVGGLRSRLLMAQGGVKLRHTPDRSFELKVFGWSVDSDIESWLQAAAGPVRRDLHTRQHRIGGQAIYRDAWRAANTEWALAAGSERLGIGMARASLRSPQGVSLGTVVNPAEHARRRIDSLTLEMNTDWADRRWSLVYGGRYDHYSDFGGHASPRLGLIHHPRPDSAVKLLYGQAFRAPSAVEIGGAQNSVLGNPDLKPEIIDSLELIALRQTPHLLAQLTVFRTLWRNGIAAVPAAPGRLSQYRNVDRNDAYGATASLEWRRDGWLVDAALSHVRSRNSRSGAEYNTFPRHMLSLSLIRALPDPSWKLAVHQRWMSRVDDIPATDAYPKTPLPRFTRTDATLSKALSRGSTASLQLRNVFDRANRLPSPPASLGGIPDERFSVTFALQHRY